MRIHGAICCRGLRGDHRHGELGVGVGTQPEPAMRVHKHLVHPNLVCPEVSGQRRHATCTNVLNVTGRPGGTWQ
jgi:hypothetical protein